MLWSRIKKSKMRRQPKIRKYRKQFKGGTGKQEPRGDVGKERRTRRGDYGLRVCEVGRISARQREAGRRVRRQQRSRSGKVWRGGFPATPVTKKPREVRMGKGKGSVEYWARQVRPGQRRYEVQRPGGQGGKGKGGVMRALHKVSHKRPISTKRVQRGKEV